MNELPHCSHVTNGRVVFIRLGAGWSSAVVDTGAANAVSATEVASTAATCRSFVLIVKKISNTWRCQKHTPWIHLADKNGTSSFKGIRYVAPVLMTSPTGKSWCHHLRWRSWWMTPELMWYRAPPTLQRIA